MCICGIYRKIADRLEAPIAAYFFSEQEEKRLDFFGIELEKVPLHQTGRAANKIPKHISC